MRELVRNLRLAAFVACALSPFAAWGGQARGTMVVRAQVVDACAIGLDGTTRGGAAHLVTSCASGFANTADLRADGSANAKALRVTSALVPRSQVGGEGADVMLVTLTF